jgi:hypothetical protein
MLCGETQSQPAGSIEWRGNRLDYVRPIGNCGL